MDTTKLERENLSAKKPLESVWAEAGKEEKDTETRSLINYCVLQQQQKKSTLEYISADTLPCRNTCEYTAFILKKAVNTQVRHAS